MQLNSKVLPGKETLQEFKFPFLNEEKILYNNILRSKLTMKYVKSKLRKYAFL